MNEKIRKKLENFKKQDYKNLRTDGVLQADSSFYDPAVAAGIFRKLAENEKPVLFDDDSFGFNRATKTKLHCPVGNITPNYARIIAKGFDQTLTEIRNAVLSEEDHEKKAYGNLMIHMLESAEIISENYLEAAKQAGNEKLYKTLLKIPHKGADDFYEALVFMKFCIFFLRLFGIPHLTLGRFDQYLYPFYEKSRAFGASDDELFEMIEEFFISINYDTDLYPGVQQGDNGQSMVLGGFDKDGKEMFNELSKMCMDASLELSLIDPKINLRVGKNTSLELYEYATCLTKKGLGFPQYCNDDIVIPGLIKLGYSPEDAYDYTVAACWEYIVPNCAMDIPNIATMNFPKIVNQAITEHLLECENFEALMKYVREEIIKECDRLVNLYAKTSLPQVPLLSVFVDGCIESLTDATKHGGKYMNFGCHGTGIANATDALTAVRKLIYDEKRISAQELLLALENDFEDFYEIRNALKNCPKMGNNNDYADEIASELIDIFAANMNHRPNGVGGIWRVGTGSAMEYIHCGKVCSATADGRKAGEPFASSFSPSLEVKPDGLLSVISSFTKYDMTNIINGGPLTIEVHDTVFRNDIGIQKTAALVKCFIDMGGHQLQINSVNRETLLDAQKHPEKYPNLIVRVWGWSGYFNELDKQYQDHIIRRCEFQL